jgi:hypothetical protein
MTEEAVFQVSGAKMTGTQHGSNQEQRGHENKSNRYLRIPTVEHDVIVLLPIA